MIQPQAQWTSPTPIWPGLADATMTPDRTLFRRPTILRFTTDEFMDEFLKILGHAPQRLGDWQAVWETWRQPAPDPLPLESTIARSLQVHNQNLGLPAPDNGSTTALEQAGTVPELRPLKLYQPAHQRFYLISASLVCRIPGLPDRELDINRGEKATFVIRRLLPSQDGLSSGPPTSNTLDQFDEYGFVLTPQGQSWQRLGSAGEDKSRSLLPDEDQLPLFGVTYPESAGRKRRLLAGLVPVGKRETYIGSALAAGDGPAENGVVDEGAGGQKPMDPRQALFISQVVAPWNSLADQKSNVEKRHPIDVNNAALLAEIGQRLADAGVAAGDIDGKAAVIAGTVVTDNLEIRRQTTNQLQIASWYVLLDFAEFLQTHLKSVWDVLPNSPTGALTDQEEVLVTTLKTTTSKGVILAQALVDIEDFRARLEAANLAYDDDDMNGSNLLLPGENGEPGGFASSLASPPPGFLLTEIAAALVTNISDAIAGALENSSDQAVTAPPLPLAAQLSESGVDANDPGWFIIRCVYERTHCVYDPPVVVSEASVPFQLASFFDPDGPARPVRISLPLDTSPAGLAKFAKNNAFVMSDILACQIGQVRDITLADLVLSVLPWPFHKDLPVPEDGDCKDSGTSDGMVCSLSIPIVTLCALILLIIIVTLFENFFHWIQFFIVCFRIPGLKGKAST